METFRWRTSLVRAVNERTPFPAASLHRSARAEAVTWTTSLMLRLSRWQASTTGNQSVSASRYPVRGTKRTSPATSRDVYERKGGILCLGAQITYSVERTVLLFDRGHEEEE